MDRQFVARLLPSGKPEAVIGCSQIRDLLMHDCDMVVIGFGPSGRRAAVQFAKLNKSVLVLEKGRRVGSVSAHAGIIPSKTLRETVLNLSGRREPAFYGRSYRVKQDIGAGVIGVEYATIFSALDVAVTLIEPRPTLLDFIDQELIEEFMHELRDRNVALRLGSAVSSIEHAENGSIVTRLADGRHVASEMLLFAGGRVGPTDRLNLEAAAIAVDHRGRITVDPMTLQTRVPHIYAAGDVIGFPSRLQHPWT
jgi:pyruvate/2-oxoglutarate dehydrogenase complex dihydrolipoamide dehydrogenase (E3) component